MAGISKRTHLQFWSAWGGLVWREGVAADWRPAVVRAARSVRPRSACGGRRTSQRRAGAPPRASRRARRLWRGGEPGMAGAARRHHAKTKPIRKVASRERKALAGMGPRRISKTNPRLTTWQGFRNEPNPARGELRAQRRHGKSVPNEFLRRTRVGRSAAGGVRRRWPITG